MQYSVYLKTKAFKLQGRAGPIQKRWLYIMDNLKTYPFSLEGCFVSRLQNTKLNNLMKAYLSLFFQFYSGKCNIYENYRIKYSDTKQHPAASQQLTLE